MSPFGRALVGSALVHLGAFALAGLFSRDVRPHEPERIELQILRLPSAAHAGDGAAGGGGPPAIAQPGPGSAGGAPAPSRGSRERAAVESAAAAPPAAETAPTRTQEDEGPAPDAPPARPATSASAPKAAPQAAAPAAAPSDEARDEAAPDGGPSLMAAITGSGGGGDRTGNGAGTGSGNGSGSGTGTGTGSGSGSGGGDDHAALLAHLRRNTGRCYPRAARQRRTEGVSDVAFCLDAAGMPTRVELRRTSGSQLLDDAAVDCVVRGSAPLPARELCASVPIDFRLR